MKTDLFKIVVILLLSYGTIATAQIPVSNHLDIDKFSIIDTVQTNIIYSLKVITNPSKPENLIEDRCVLQIGQKISKTYSQLIYQHDSLITNLRKSRPERLPGLQKPVPPIEIYRNYPNKNECTVVYRTWGPNAPILKYVEEIPKFDWAIHTEKKEFLGYSCIRATTEFRGRNYEAWFAPSIPLFEGPWKFCGLPGLIMQIQDSENHYQFECIGIENPINKTIKYWDSVYKEVTRTQYMTILKRMYNSPSQWFQSLGMKISVVGQNVDKFSYPFNELELR